MAFYRPQHPGIVPEQQVIHLESALSASIARSPCVPDITAKSLDDLLLQCVDEVLADLLGRRTREAVYDCLERNHSLARSDIPNNLNTFFELLEETFGKGSSTIGKSIIKRLYAKLEWTFADVPGFQFTDYMERVRARYARALVELAKSIWTNQ
jgi:hypothetical protein